MNRCPITYLPCDHLKYSREGLRLLSKELEHLEDFSYSSKEQIELAMRYAAKLSIQGVQPKLSVRLKVAKGAFEIVERRGTFIFKPPHPVFPELPQNEDLTMRLAALVGIDVPLHGMIYNIDGTLTYFIQRFDRLGKGKKLAVEDFSQLSGHSRETKYDFTMEKLIPILMQHCTFPVLEKLKLFRLILFNFVTGNEDMHLKNFSIIRRQDKAELSPAYDLLNTTLVLSSGEELALPLRGKKSKIKRVDLLDYFGIERLGLPSSVISEELERFHQALVPWRELIHSSFLSDSMRERYLQLVDERFKRLNL